MKKYTPIEKLSKRERKAYYANQRRTWGELNPVTRKPENPKAYDRQKSRNWRDDPHDSGTSFLLRHTV